MQRWILHIDMDAFFASIEQMDHPEWRGLPVIVGGDKRGVVAAASYEARVYGVHSAMPMFQAKKLCPYGIYTGGRRDRYMEISRQIMEVLQGFSPVLEQCSIDEAFVDGTGLERLFGPIERLGTSIKAAVHACTGLTCSVGAAPVKFLAKIASDLNKPNGLSILYPENIPSFLGNLPLEKIPGLGPQTLKGIRAMGVSTAGEAQKLPEEFWVRRFGKIGLTLFERCHGIDPREVEPYVQAKSESAENTLERDTDNMDELKAWLLRQAERVGASLRKHGHKGRTVTLKIKYSDFRQITRSHSLKKNTDSTMIIYETATGLLDALAPRERVRLIGVGVSNFAASQSEASLTLPGIMPEKPSRLTQGNLDETKEASLDKALDALRQKFGPQAVVRGRIFENKGKPGG